MIIKNGRVFQEDGTFAEKDLYIEGKRFVSTKEEVIDQEVIDAKGMMVLPGLVDVHSHGAAGHDFSDGDVEGLKEILRYEKAHGILLLPDIHDTAKRRSAENLRNHRSNQR